MERNVLSSKGRILIVEDDGPQREDLALALRAWPLEIQVAPSVAHGMQRIKEAQFHAVLCHLSLHDGKGTDLLKYARDKEIETPVIIYTENADWEAAERCLTGGAFDFLSRPFGRLELLAALRRALIRSGLLFERLSAGLRAKEPPQFPFLIGRSATMRDVLRHVAKVAEADASVCIYGESGTGKELVARAIHYLSGRKAHPMIVFDSAAIPEGLMESELFGHVKGAFTSAIRDREGAFHLADGGTIFFDEIAELSLPLQAKLLRVIQSREFRKVGGTQSKHVDVRIICATNKDLSVMVSRNLFREDLFYRLEVVAITLPPLRERKDDIPLLVNHFIEKFNRSNKKAIRGIHPRTMGALMRYHWPGNVRELENFVERAAVMSDTQMLDATDIGSLMRPTPSRPHAEMPTSLREAEQNHVIRALEAAQGNRKQAAALLGISERNLYYKLKAIDPARLPPVSRSKQSQAEVS